MQLHCHALLGKRKWCAYFFLGVSFQSIRQQCNIRTQEWTKTRRLLMCRKNETNALRKNKMSVPSKTIDKNTPSCYALELRDQCFARKYSRPGAQPPRSFQPSHEHSICKKRLPYPHGISPHTIAYTSHNAFQQHTKTSVQFAWWNCSSISPSQVVSSSLPHALLCRMSVETQLDPELSSSTCLLTSCRSLIPAMHSRFRWPLM